MFWDDLIRHWRRENPSLGPRLLAGTAGHVAVVPARTRRSRRGLLVLVVALLALLALALSAEKVGGEPAASARIGAAPALVVGSGDATRSPADAG